MSVAELARKYYPRLWDKSRLEALAPPGGCPGRRWRRSPPRRENKIRLSRGGRI